MLCFDGADERLPVDPLPRVCGTLITARKRSLLHIFPLNNLTDLIWALPDNWLVQGHPGTERDTDSGPRMAERRALQSRRLDRTARAYHDMDLIRPPASQRAGDLSQQFLLDELASGEEKKKMDISTFSCHPSWW